MNESVSPDIPAAGLVAAFVEAMEAIGKVGSKPQQNLVRPASGQQGVRQQGQLVEARILQNLEGPCTFRSQEQRLRDLHLLGVENDEARVSVHLQLDADNSREVEGGQVGVYGQVIVEGGHCFGKSHVVPRKRLATGGYGHFLVLSWVWQLSS